MLAPLTRLNSIQRRFKWAHSEQDTSDEINQIVVRNTLLTYPDFNETFKSHTNASALQLGVVIIQKGKPIALLVEN